MTIKILRRLRENAKDKREGLMSIIVRTTRFFCYFVRETKPLAEARSSRLTCSRNCRRGPEPLLRFPEQEEGLRALRNESSATLGSFYGRTHRWRGSLGLFRGPSHPLSLSGSAVTCLERGRPGPRDEERECQKFLLFARRHSSRLNILF